MLSGFRLTCCNLLLFDFSQEQMTKAAHHIHPANTAAHEHSLTQQHSSGHAPQPLLPPVPKNKMESSPDYTEEDNGYMRSRSSPAAQYSATTV